MLHGVGHSENIQVTLRISKHSISLPCETPESGTIASVCGHCLKLTHQEQICSFRGSKMIGLTNRSYVTHQEVSTRTLAPTSMSSPSAFKMRNLHDQVLKVKQGSLTCHISSFIIERAEVLYSVVFTCQQHFLRKERARKSAHPHFSCHLDFSRSGLRCM